MYLKSSLWLPNDFMVDPVLLALKFTQLAITKGVKFIEDCCLEEILTEKQRIINVMYLLIVQKWSWARELGFQTSPSVRIPTQACEYICLKTKPMANFPTIHNPEEPIFSNGVPDAFHFSLLPDNWDDFYWILSNTMKRFPILAESECKTLITGADSFTPDGRLIMNESAEIYNYFVAIQI
ncbi:unnamed protein product [Adineta steineri]|uniref:Uncharacterized protein n=1 Tax=Adineta steineri TaxID=433720 RepID=A0A819N5I7_9BILA|nr:unnamed protein product [Adineta steineri]